MGCFSPSFFYFQILNTHNRITTWNNLHHYFFYSQVTLSFRYGTLLLWWGRFSRGLRLQTTLPTGLVLATVHYRYTSRLFHSFQFKCLVTIELTFFWHVRFVIFCRPQPVSLCRLWYCNKRYLLNSSSSPYPSYSFPHTNPCTAIHDRQPILVIQLRILPELNVWAGKSDIKALHGQQL